MKLDFNVIIDSILMTTDAILLMIKGATMTPKLAMDPTWKMKQVSATTDTVMMTT